MFIVCKPGCSQGNGQADSGFAAKVLLTVCCCCLEQQVQHSLLLGNPTIGGAFGGTCKLTRASHSITVMHDLWAAMVLLKPLIGGIVTAV